MARKDFQFIAETLAASLLSQGYSEGDIQSVKQIAVWAKALKTQNPLFSATRFCDAVDQAMRG